MARYHKRSFLRGGLYHAALILVVTSSFNWGFVRLTGIDIAGRVFSGTSLPIAYIAISVCISSVIVIWDNWVD